MRNRGMSVLAVCVCVMAVCVGMAAARGKSFKNSGFEHGDFSGWQTKQEGDTGMWAVYKGTPDIATFFPDIDGNVGVTLRKPRRGKYAASSVQEGPGTRLLFHNLTLKPNSKNKIAFLLSYQNLGGTFFNPTPDSLHTGTVAPLRYPAAARGGVSAANQQFRVDIVRKGSDPYSIDSSDVLKNLIKSKAGDPAESGWKRYSFSLGSLDPGKVKLRVAEADTQGSLFVGFDALKLQGTTRK